MAFGLVEILLLVMFVSAGAMYVLGQEHLAQARRMLNEVKQCNREFAAAMTLFKHGETEDAIEMCMRAQQRGEKDQDAARFD